MLARLLNAFRTTAGSLTYWCTLYQNDYTPHPGTVSADFIWCTYPGYLSLPFAISDFPPATVTTNVALLTLNHALTFAAASIGTFSQDVYGYVVFDNLWNYAWSERFAAPYTQIPGSSISLTPRYKHATCVAPLLSRRRKRAVAG